MTLDQKLMTMLCSFVLSVRYSLVSTMRPGAESSGTHAVLLFEKERGERGDVPGDAGICKGARPLEDLADDPHVYPLLSTLNTPGVCRASCGRSMYLCPKDVGIRCLSGQWHCGCDLHAS